MTTEIDSVTDKVVNLFGGQAALGRAVGVKQQVVHYWVNTKGCIPAEHILHLEALLRDLGSDLDRYDLRPDVYGQRPEVVLNDESGAAA